MFQGFQTVCLFWLTKTQTSILFKMYWKLKCKNHIFWKKLRHKLKKLHEQNVFIFHYILCTNFKKIYSEIKINKKFGKDLFVYLAYRKLLLYFISFIFIADITIACFSISGVIQKNLYINSPKARTRESTAPL